MSVYDSHRGTVLSQRENKLEDSKLWKTTPPRRSLRAQFDGEFNRKKESRTSSATWCDALSVSLPNPRNAKQALKHGADKLTQTFSNVRSTLGNLSQKITKATKRRQPLINIDSPRTPATPQTKCRVLLGRTPTKLYSPFHVDVDHHDKENRMLENVVGVRRSLNRSDPGSVAGKTERSYRDEEPVKSFLSSPEKKFSNDLLQAQIGIYEFQSVANRIVFMEKANH